MPQAFSPLKSTSSAWDAAADGAGLPHGAGVGDGHVGQGRREVRLGSEHRGEPPGERNVTGPGVQFCLFFSFKEWGELLGFSF